MGKNYKDKVAAAVSELGFETTNYKIKFNTNMGDIVLKLYQDLAPKHCENLIGLVKSGFYDNLTFHRVIPGFVIQGGCPNGNGIGGPGYQIKAEFNQKPHKAGVLSMARSQDPDSAGSQFFLCLGDVAHLDGQYTAFGEAADQASLDVILKIGDVETSVGDVPTSPVVIESAQVLESSK